eukprot:gene25277-33807_t
MGNSNRRDRSTPTAATTIERSRVLSSVSLSPSLPTLAIKEDWREVSYVKKLIIEKKLAPTPASDSEVRDKECPICFLNYENLNSVVCCNQNVCTDCFVQLKIANDKCACPFCGKDTLSVTFIADNSPSPPKKLGTLTTQLPKETPKTETFEKTSDIFIPRSSKSDRDALEDQIRNQRSSLEDESAGARVFSRSFTSPSSTTSSSMSFQRYRSHNIIRTAGNSAYRGDGSISSMMASSDSRNGPPQRGRRTLRDALATSQQSLANSPSNDIFVPGTYSPRYRRHNGNESLTFLSSGDAVTTATTGSVDRPARLDALSESQNDVLVSDNGNGRDLFVNSISNLLGSEQLSSLEQLEELMLMEAIRLSMNDVSMPTSFAPISSDEQAGSDYSSTSTQQDTNAPSTSATGSAGVEHSHMEAVAETNNNCEEDLDRLASVIAGDSSNGCNDDEDNDGIAFDNLKIRFKKSGSGSGIMHSRDSSGSVPHDGIIRKICESPVISPSIQHIPVTTFGKVSADEPKGDCEGSAAVGGLRHSTPYTSREHISGICTPQIWDTLEPQKEDHFSVDRSGSGSWDYSHDEAVNNNETSKSATSLNFDSKDKNDFENDVVKADKFSRHGSASGSMDFSSSSSSSSSSLLEKIQLALDSPSASCRSEGRPLFRKEDGGGVGNSRSDSIGYSVVTPENLSSGTSLVFFKEADEAVDEMQK